MMSTVRRIPRREGFGSLVDCLADKADMKQMTTQEVSLCSHSPLCKERPFYVDVLIWCVAPIRSSRV
jgi:hypothetical protein